MTSCPSSAPPSRLAIQLDPGAEPIRGWLQQGIDPWQSFHGMTELIALLDSARQRAAREEPPAGHPTSANP